MFKKITIIFLMMLISATAYAYTSVRFVCNMPSSSSVQVRVYDVTAASEIVAWTATGVSERSVGLSKSCYYYTSTLTAGNAYQIDWRDSGTPTKVASETLSNTDSWMDAALSGRPTLAQIEATTVLAKQAKLDTLHDTRIPGVVQPQTGDSYAIVSNVTYGNAALKSQIDDVHDDIQNETAAIKAKTNNLPSDPADQSLIIAATDAIKSDSAAIKTSTDHLTTAMELDGAVYRFTTNALEQGPSSGGLDLWLSSSSSYTVPGTMGAIVAGIPSGVYIIPSQVSAGVIPGYITYIDSELVTIYRGDTIDFAFNLGTGWNLTNKKVYFIAKSSKSALNSTAIVNRECSIVDAVNGLTAITLTSAETATGGTYYAEIEVRNTDDTAPKTARQFKLKVDPDVRQ